MEGVHRWMESSLTIFFFFALVYYLSLIVVYLLRAHELEELELKMGPWFSIQLIPFSLLWVINLLYFYDVGRLMTGIPRAQMCLWFVSFL